MSFRIGLQQAAIMREAAGSSFEMIERGRNEKDKN